MKFEQIAGIIILLLLLYQGMLARQIIVQKEIGIGTFVGHTFHIEFPSMKDLRCSFFGNCEEQQLKFSQSLNMFPLVVIGGILIILKLKR